MMRYTARAAHGLFVFAPSELSAFIAYVLVFGHRDNADILNVQYYTIGIWRLPKLTDLSIA